MRISDWSSDVCSSDLSAASSCAGTGAASNAVTSLPQAAATSKAIPRTLKQSARLGVSLSSMLASGRPRYSASGVPGGASSGSSSRPEASASMPSSFAEHSMPLDSTPRSFRSEEHTSELQSLMSNSYAVFRLDKTIQHRPTHEWAYGLTPVHHK